MEKKKQILYPTDCNLLIMQDLWQADYQILLIILLQKFIEFNVNMDKIMQCIIVSRCIWGLWKYVSWNIWTDPTCFLVAPGLKWQTTLQKTKVKLYLFTDIDMLLMVKELLKEEYVLLICKS